jgi:hypothetical protein
VPAIPWAVPAPKRYADPLVTLFNLLTNPFYLLAVDPAATNQRVDDAVRTGTLTSDQARARIAILDPSQRLAFELSYPIDSQPKQIEALYKAISDHSPASEIQSLAAELGSLSRANLIAHLAADQPASGAILHSLLDAHASIEIPAVFDILRSLRSTAGWVAPSLVSVNDGVQALLQLQVRAAIAGYANPEQAAAQICTCISEILAEPGQYHLEALARLVAAYREHAGNRLAKSISQIQEACAALRGNPGDVESRGEMAAAMRAWVAIYLPLFIFTRQTAADEELAVCADHVRDVVGDLIDEHHFDAALGVAQSARDAFAPLPDIAAEFDKAIPLIEQWSREASLDELQLCIDQIAIDPVALDSILKNGFGPGSVDDGQRFWESFLETTRPATSEDDEPWLMVRDLAGHLAEHAQRGSVAKAILMGLIAHGEQVSVSPTVLAELERELQKIESPPSPPRPLQEVERKPSRFARGEVSGRPRVGPAKVKFVVALLGAFGTAAALYYGGERLRSLVPLRAVSPGQSAAEAETIPAVGTGQHLELSGVRYCHYQEERLKIMKPDVKSPDDARAFNLLIVDYNSRCSDFFFKDADLAVVKAEIAASRGRLEADAKAIISTWPGHTPLARN